MPRPRQAPGNVHLEGFLPNQLGANWLTEWLICMIQLVLNIRLLSRCLLLRQVPAEGARVTCSQQQSWVLSLWQDSPSWHSTWVIHHYPGGA